jgi:hypothetical protein
VRGFNREWENKNKQTKKNLEARDVSKYMFVSMADDAEATMEMLVYLTRRNASATNVASSSCSITPSMWSKRASAPRRLAVMTGDPA